MNKVYSIFGVLFGLILLTSVVWQSVVIVHFYVNQAEIEENYCINKDKPELNCHGQCHLNQILQQNEDTKVEEKSTNTSPRFGLVILQFKSNFANITLAHLRKTPSIFHQIHEKTSDYCSSFLDPPELI